MYSSHMFDHLIYNLAIQLFTKVSHFFHRHNGIMCSRVNKIFYGAINLLWFLMYTASFYTHFRRNFFFSIVLNLV